MSRPFGVASMRAATRRWHRQNLAPYLISVCRRTALACASARRNQPASTGGSLRRSATSYRLRFSTLRAHRVGERFHHLLEHDVAGQTEDVAQAVGLAPRHHLMAAVMTIATNGDARVRPVAADTPHHAPHMAADLLAARRLAW